jgi:hypothetical protein
MACDGLVYGLAVIGAVCRHGSDLALGRLKQRRDLTGVIGTIVSQHASDDLEPRRVSRRRFCLRRAALA